MLKFATLLLVGAPFLAFCWAYGGCIAGVLAKVMPWASLACAAGVFLVPQCHPGEERGAAWRRVLKAVVRDPFFWIALALMIYLAVPLFNVALCPVCDWQAIDAGENPYPPCRFLPFCVNRAEHGGLLWMFGPALLTALGVRHGLTRSGKRRFLMLVVWNAALMSAFGLVQLVTGAKFPFWGVVERPVHFFSVFGYPNMAGTFFAVAYALSLGAWCVSLGEVELKSLDPKTASGHPFLRAHYLFVAVALNLTGALASLSRAAILLVVALTFLFVVYMGLRLFAGGSHFGAIRFRGVVACFSLFLALWGAIYVYAPDNVWREVKSVDVNALADRVSGKAQYHTRIASSIMRDFPLFGVGGWGYRHFQQCYMTVDERKMPQYDGGANVHNDYMQFLAEHGIVGFAFLAACVCLLAFPTFREWKRRTGLARAEDRLRMSASTATLFAVAAPILWAFLGSVVMLVQAFGDCPMRSGAIFSLFLTLQSASFGYFPRDVGADD